MLAFEHCAGKTPCSIRRKPLCIIVVGLFIIIIIACLSGAPHLGPSSRPAGEPFVASADLAEFSAASTEQEPEPPATKRAYLRSWTGDEGFGSYLQHFKQSIVLAKALDSEHILSYSKIDVSRVSDAERILASPNIKGEYSPSQFWNGQLGSSVGKPPLRFPVDGSRVCLLERYVPPHIRTHLVNGLCEGEPSALAEMAEIKARMAHCTSVLDSTDGSEVEEGLNGCIAGWVRARVGPARQFVVPPLADPPTRPITVGVHVRWGDSSAHLNRTGAFYGSMDVHDILRILHDIRARWGGPGGAGVRVKIAMSASANGGAMVLGQLNTTDTDLDANANANAANTLELLDSGDPIADLYTLSNNDILLGGSSSYALLAHVIAPAGLTIAGHGSMHKFTNTTGFGRHVVPLEEYTPDSLGLALT
ncbi:hypothetical protein GGX14DRAFT_538338 [Mycena pura]|uniref:Uncharacterized protein n=1 Tax=Mycena pura TaxID=153505 RepID=A0AAD7E6F6_9AGAR|nr:hypothetical protein GGX14DRAFT_538338 [Mycena pura]